MKEDIIKKQKLLFSKIRCTPDRKALFLQLLPLRHQKPREFSGSAFAPVWEALSQNGF